MVESILKLKRLSCLHISKNHLNDDSCEIVKLLFYPIFEELYMNWN